MAENMPMDNPQRTMSTSVNMTSSKVMGKRRLMSSTMSILVSRDAPRSPRTISLIQTKYWI